MGFGNVGKTLFKQIKENSKNITKMYGVNFLYCGIYTSKKGIFNANGISFNTPLQFTESNVPRIFHDLKNSPKPLIVIDTTAADETFPILKKALEQNAFVVMSNKKPLASEQEKFDVLQVLGKQRLFYEATVGAGLPIIKTLQALLTSGDEILEIQGCFSGTLGFICSQLEKGIDFSQAIAEAREKGYTEPDPRDDLSGIDVARKALILARLLDQKVELQNIAVEKLYPEILTNLPLENFIQKIKTLDRKYRSKFTIALKSESTFRYVAKILQKKVTVGLYKVSKKSIIGNLQGPENIIIIKTKRYHDYPLVISGPGAGLAVTAAGVFGDMLTIASTNF